MADAKGGERFHSSTSKQADVRMSNIVAAKAVADAIRTSLGPKGMDKMIQAQGGEVIITNDGATIMKHLQVFHPTAKMLVELSTAQDIEAGDGTTSVVVLAGSLLNACQSLLEKGIHPTAISESFQAAQAKAEEFLKTISIPVELNERDELIKAAVTSMSSKVISQNSDFLAPLAVDAVLAVTNSTEDSNVDLSNVKMTKAVGGTIDDTELVHGLVFNRKASHVAGAPTRIENAKIGLIQFCLSAPKTDMDNSVVVSDYTQMDKILRDERKYILGLCKQIQKSGCNVLLVQKSVLRDAVNDLSLHFLSKMKIMVVSDVERDDIEFISKTLGCKPVAHVDHFTAEKLGTAALASESSVGGGQKVIKITGVANPGRTVSVLVRGSNKLVVDETERSIHDSLCVVRSIVKKRALIVGGGAPEIEVAQTLNAWAKTLTGMQQYCVRAYADAMEVIPYTLAENAGLNPIVIVTELRRLHAEGHKTAGINVRKGTITDMVEENVVQPLLVSTSALTLATETCRMILKVDDMVPAR
jgi:T-complex protein 1 subunit delta